MEQLPEGISYNQQSDDLLEMEIPIDSTVDWICDQCNLALESLLLALSDRYSGMIRNKATQLVLWENKLPRDLQKAKKMLQETLDKRVERHRQGH